MATIGLEMGDVHDRNHYFPIVATTEHGLSRIGVLSEYCDGKAAITIYNAGKMAFASHDEARNHLRFI